MKKYIKIIPIILIAIGIILLFQGFEKIENLSSDCLRYKYSNGYIYITDIKMGSFAYYSGIQINDTLISINNKRILNKHSLYNKVFEKYKPGDILNYKIKRKNDYKFFNIELNNYHSLTNRLFIYIASIIVYIVSILFFIISDKRFIDNIFFLIIYTSSLLITYINIPFSNQWMYIVFMLLTLLFTIGLLIFSILLNHSLKHYKFLIISIVFLTLITIVWSIFYILWTNTLIDSYYKLTINTMKLFHLILLLIFLHTLTNTFIKLTKLFNLSVNYYILSFIIILSIILSLYPVFLALPVIIKNKTFIQLEYYFFLYGILAIYTLIFYNKIKYLLHYEK